MRAAQQVIRLHAAEGAYARPEHNRNNRQYRRHLGHRARAAVAHPIRDSETAGCKMVSRRALRCFLVSEYRAFRRDGEQE